jgi:hypothetical protein
MMAYRSITEVEPDKNHQLILRFDNGERSEMTPPAFRPTKDELTKDKMTLCLYLYLHLFLRLARSP